MPLPTRNFSHFWVTLRRPKWLTLSLGWIFECIRLSPENSSIPSPWQAASWLLWLWLWLDPHLFLCCGPGIPKIFQKILQRLTWMDSFLAWRSSIFQTLFSILWHDLLAFFTSQLCHPYSLPAHDASCHGIWQSWYVGKLRSCSSTQRHHSVVEIAYDSREFIRIQLENLKTNKQICLGISSGVKGKNAPDHWLTGAEPPFPFMVWVCFCLGWWPFRCCDDLGGCCQTSFFFHRRTLPWLVEWFSCQSLVLLIEPSFWLSATILRTRRFLDSLKQLCTPSSCYP